MPQIDLIGCRGLAVGLGRLLVTADALEDVRGHVLEMARGRHHPDQPLGRRHRLLGVLRGLDGVDPIMVGAGMGRVLRQHNLQRGEDVRGAGPGGAVGIPQLPRVGVHQRFGGERLDVHVGREAGGDGAHRGDIGLERCGAVRGI